MSRERGRERERHGPLKSPHLVKNAANRDIPRLLPHENHFGLSKNPKSTFRASQHDKLGCVAELQARPLFSNFI